MDVNEALINLELEFCYEGEKKQALTDVKVAIEQGKCVVLCGSSGCGKSTFLRCINHLIPQFYEGTLKGFCHINSRDINELSIGDVGELAASVFQDPRSQFFTMNSCMEVAFGLENFGVSREKMIQRVEEAFDRFGLNKLKDRNVFELSSGERQLIAILSAWAVDTEILLLDEPTANLDFGAIQQLSEILLQLKEQGKTILINEHRLYYLNDVVDEYWFMQEGKIVKQFSKQEMLLLSVQDLAEMGLRVTNSDAITFVAKNITGSAEIVNTVSVQNVKYAYDKEKREILSNVSLVASTGEVVGIVGSNGCGKTTLGKIVAGLLKPSEGQIFYNEKEVKSKQLLAKSIFIMQEAEFQFFTNSVINELRYGRRLTKDVQDEIDELLKNLGMWECRNRHPFSLSGGQMQKLTLMLAYLSPKQIVILDEPTAGLDQRSLECCTELIAEMRKKKIVFIITHDLELIARICSRCVYLAKGKVEKEFILSNDVDFHKLAEYMREHIGISEIDKQIMPYKPAKQENLGEWIMTHQKENTFLRKRASRLCDPRIKLLYVLVTLVLTASYEIDIGILTGVVAATSLLLMYERRYWNAFAGGGIYGLLMAIYVMFPSPAMNFIIVFFPKFLLIWMVLSAIMENGDSSRLTAAFRKLHVPEKMIMLSAVITRYFPVLSKDLKLMSQSIKTRDVFVSFKDKIKKLPEYCEIMIVPMVFRVIRIAETLSASAETRGIALKRKRNSYIELQFKAADMVMVVLLVASIAVGIIL